MSYLNRMIYPLLMLLTTVAARSLFEDEGDSLPEDTFRKLAAVLYKRGDKAENRLTRKYLYNSNVTCNDGTSAGYYIRRNSESRRWVIFLEGGWYCYDKTSCEARWLRLRTLMSSDRWPEVKTVGGILSSDSAENPHFAEANHVLLPYCSSDSWSGTAKKGAGQKFAFLGAEIVTEVVKELFSWEQLGSGRELYLAGSSAGGTGVLVNLDPVADLVKLLGSPMRVRGIVDSGWFLDNDPFSSSSKPSMSPSLTVSTGAHMWRARVPDSCAQSFPGEEWKCFFGYRIYPTMKTPVFVFQWQFDEAQMTADNVGAPVTQAQWNFIHHQGRNIRRTFESVTAVFAPSCISHTVITKPDWTKVTVDGITLPDAIECWVSQTQPGEEEIPDEDDMNHSYIAQKYIAQSHGVSHTHMNDYMRPMLADSPQDSLKRINANLIKSIDRYQTNSMANRTKKLRHKSNIVDNRTNKRNKKRNKKHRRRCKYGDTLENRIRCAKEENEEHRRHELHQYWSNEGGVQRNNRDLVKSLDRNNNNIQEKKRKRRRRKRQRSVSDNRKLTKEERRQMRREERRRLKKLLKNKSKNENTLRHGRRLRMRHPKRTFPNASNYSQLPERRSKKQHSLTVRSIRTGSSAKCQLKHVDVCSWPQCNRSCPKLHNPLTGEEMDFLDLLESFGLDMKSVAHALGIDIATLNNMDKDVLLHLLTSQTSSVN